MPRTGPATLPGASSTRSEPAAAGAPGDQAFRTLTKHLDHIGALQRGRREQCSGPLVVHLANLAECHAPGGCGLHYRWHPRTSWQRCWDATGALLVRCDDCDPTPGNRPGPRRSTGAR
jgi:hypothetical protein